MSIEFDYRRSRVMIRVGGSEGIVIFDQGLMAVWAVMKATASTSIAVQKWWMKKV